LCRMMVRTRCERERFKSRTRLNPGLTKALFRAVADDPDDAVLLELVDTCCC
jgi:hypothetical protein